jgi:hypothetical protein
LIPRLKEDMSDFIKSMKRKEQIKIKISRRRDERAYLALN